MCAAREDVCCDWDRRQWRRGRGELLVVGGLGVDQELRISRRESADATTHTLIRDLLCGEGYSSKQAQVYKEVWPPGLDADPSRSYILVDPRPSGQGLVVGFTCSRSMTVARSPGTPTMPVI